MVLALVLGLGLAYAAQFELDYGEKDNTTTIAIFNAVGGATVTQWSWNCGEQNVLVFQVSGNAMSNSGNADAQSYGGLPPIWSLSDDNGPEGGNAGGDAGAIALSGSLAVTGNIALVDQQGSQVAQNQSNADVINTVIAKVKRINRVKLNIEDSYNEED
ncbi:MAG: hypothetical protein ABDK94_02350 [Atribacterota bacterium]